MMRNRVLHTTIVQLEKDVCTIADLIAGLGTSHWLVIDRSENQAAGRTAGRPFALAHAHRI